MRLEKMSFVPLIFPSDLLIGLVLIYEILTPQFMTLSAKLTSANLDVILLELGVVGIFLSLCRLGWQFGYHRLWIFWIFEAVYIIVHTNVN
ncbi:hypothetical protein C5167_042773 [Papaver somniferum]|uniref:Uncharacterized protein n=1 Tax=Papaver somniferum TaxID=3469 RepID=A0A4Y7L741_PAPSO|nr:hypothetical protein C5167_042166 [Papaver somniferum]RZC80201.1 hypothetical protein C5167_042773 [Papaver somniferum]